jgi:integrase
MTDITQSASCGPLHEEISEFIDFKRGNGFSYTVAEFALRAFDRFSAAAENHGLSFEQLAEKWATPDNRKPKYDGGCCVRQLGQYLQETGHPKAFTALSANGFEPRLIGMGKGPFAEEIEVFIAYKRLANRSYVAAEYQLKSFDKFCAMKRDTPLTSQQLADAWQERVSRKGKVDVSAVRELGLYLTLHHSKKAFMLPCADGKLPRPKFAGYGSLFASELESFLDAKRSSGIKYRHEEFCLRDFDRFCCEQPALTLQQLAETFISMQGELSVHKRTRSTSVLRTLGAHLAKNGHPSAFIIPYEQFVKGPYAEVISTFVAFKRSCGYTYKSGDYQLRCFDTFCASEENSDLSPQQRADKWIVRRGDECVNTRAGRVGPIRVFGKYLTSIAHPLAFVIADNAVPKGHAKPPYLFTEEDIGAFFSACAKLEPNERDPMAHIVLPAAFLFMHCMGIRTGELGILMADVDFTTGEVVIANAKNGDRVIYMSDELSDLLSKYSVLIEDVFPHRLHLFPLSQTRPRNDFSKRFGEIWTSHVFANVDDKPRLYDLRHHLLYRNVELCMHRGEDVNVLRPYVMRHMGHKKPESFQYYFHLSPPIRKEVSRIKEGLDWMMPDIPEVPYE